MKKEVLFSKEAFVSNIRGIPATLRNKALFEGLSGFQGSVREVQTVKYTEDDFSIIIDEMEHISIEHEIRRQKSFLPQAGKQIFWKNGVFVGPSKMSSISLDEDFQSFGSLVKVDRIHSFPSVDKIVDLTPIQYNFTHSELLIKDQKNESITSLWSMDISEVAKLACSLSGPLSRIAKYRLEHGI